MPYSDEITHHNSFYSEESKLIFGSFIFSLFYRKLIMRLQEQQIITPESRVLSLGCGDGHFESLIAPLVKSVVGFDISDIAVEEANRRSRYLGLANFKAVCSNIMELDPDAWHEKFDVILAIGLLHHIPEQDLPALLAQSLQVLVPGGRFVSSDPSAQRLVNVLKVAVRKKYEATHTPDERELVPKDMKALVARTGFENVSIRFYDFFMGPLSWVWPKCPIFLSRLGHAIDQILVRTPLLNRFSSAFLIFAERPR
jgi:SAM-dependent methyltransferase